MEASDEYQMDDRVDNDDIVKEEEEEDTLKHLCTASPPLLLSHR